MRTVLVQEHMDIGKMILSFESNEFDVVIIVDLFVTAHLF